MLETGLRAVDICNIKLTDIDWNKDVIYIRKQKTGTAFNVDLSPSQIVPALADKGIYIASESTMYRILKNENIQHHRGRDQAPTKSKTPDTHVANGPNQVWTWDIRYLNTSIRGIYY